MSAHTADCVHAPGHCPTCDSPSPNLHPAMQCEGEVELCRDPYHASTRFGREGLRMAGPLGLALLAEHDARGGAS